MGLTGCRTGPSAAGRLPLLCGVAVAACGLCRGAGEDPAGGVPLRVAARVLFVEARVNDTGPYPLILDTGATETVLTPPLAGRLGIRTVPVSAAQSKGSVRSISVGGAELRNFTVYVFDPPQALPLRLDKGLDYQGLLGYSFLRHFVVCIDYRQGRLDLLSADAWRRRRAAAADPGPCHSVPFDVRGGLIHADGGVNGLGPVRFLIDTGSAEALLLPDVAARLRLPVTALEDYEGVGLVRVDRLSLGEAAVSAVPAIVHRLPGERHAWPTYHGILGYPFLSNFEVTVNYPDRKLLLRPYENASAPVSAPSAGGDAHGPAPPTSPKLVFQPARGGRPAPESGP